MTLLLCLLFGNLFTLAFITAYRPAYHKNHIFVLFAIAKSLQLAFVILLLLKNLIGLRMAAPLYVPLSLAGGITEAVSILLLLGEYNGTVKRKYYVLSGMAAGGLLVLYGLFDSDKLYIAFCSLIGILIFIRPAMVLCTQKERSPLQRTMGLLYFAVILALCGRVLEALYPEALMNLQTSRLLLALFYLGIYLAMFLGSAGFLLLSKELSYAELERVATYDELTGVLNRRSFVMRARPLIAAAAREGAPFTFLLLDIDHFKEVNDTYGHEVGDRVLKDFASKIEHQLRNGDLFGRFGGEEFAMILHRADEKASDEIAERLRKAIEGSTINGTPLHYTVSIGMITVASSERVSLNTLYKLSDTALYQGKRKGRNCVVRSSSVLS